MGRAAAASGQRNPFAGDEDAALAELELAWADGGYHGFSADGGTWCAVTSAVILPPAAGRWRAFVPAGRPLLVCAGGGGGRESNPPTTQRAVHRF